MKKITVFALCILIVLILAGCKEKETIVPETKAAVSETAAPETEETAAETAAPETEAVVEETTAPEDDSPDHYIACTDEKKENVENFAKKVKETILAEDWNTLSTMCCYPVSVDGQKVNSADEFVNKMKDITLSPAFKQAVEAETCHNMFVGSDGIMLGNGEVWLNSVIDENDNTAKLVVMALNFS